MRGALLSLALIAVLVIPFFRKNLPAQQN